MRSYALALTVAALAAAPAAVHSAVIVSDDFESYADSAALVAAWPGNAATTLDTALGNPGKSAKHAGGAVNSKTFGTPLNPTAAAPIFISADIYDDGVDFQPLPGDNDGEKRMTVGLRSLAPANLIEMGMYNAGVQYVYRVVLFASGGGDGSGGQASYGKFNLGTDATGDRNRPTQGWHRYTATITDTQITFTLDLFSDGVVDATEVVAASPTAAGFNDFRFGGISGLTSAGGGANFDNLRLEIVPEPATFAIAGLAAPALLARRRR